MGTGTDAARTAYDGLNAHADMIDNFKDQLLVALLKRIGPNVTIPVAEVDATGDSIVSFSVNQDTKAFEFVVTRKQ